jgi:NodT family efflux transporter outer membrane factor (OMF) lipoprotein
MTAAAENASERKLPMRRIGRNKGRRAGASVLILALVNAGCTVGPDYAPPKTSVAPFQNAAAVAARPATNPPPTLDTWWIGFQDQQLDRVLQAALAQNLDLAAVLARVEAARGAAREAGAALLPTADASAQVSPFRQSLESPIGKIGSHLPGYRRDDALYDVGVGASWEIDLFGGLRRGSEAAVAEAQAAEAQRLGIRVTVAADTADAYFQIRGDLLRLELAHDQIATDQQLLHLVRLRLASGAAADREVAQAEALLAQARATLPPLLTALDAQHNRLDVLTGVQPGHGIALDAAAVLPAVPAIATPAQPGDLLRRRPDLVAAERRLAAANARIGVATAEYYPKVSLSGLLGFESLGPSQLFTGDAFQPEAVAGLRWRLFDFGKIDAEVAQADAGTAAALADYRQAVLRATEDVEDAMMALVQQESRTRTLTQEVDALTRARDRSLEDYRAGAIDLTDVLEADRELLVAQDQLAETRADADRAAVATFRALGGGW